MALPRLTILVHDILYDQRVDGRADVTDAEPASHEGHPMKLPPQNLLTASGLLILRAITGIIFFANGWQKTFLDGPEATAAAFADINIPFSNVVGPAIGLLELLGGALLVLGLATRFVALLLAGDMIVAFLAVHAAGGIFGSELVLILAASTLALAFLGAGRTGLDVLFPRRLALTQTAATRT